MAKKKSGAKEGVLKKKPATKKKTQAKKERKAPVGKKATTTIEKSVLAPADAASAPAAQPCLPGEVARNIVRRCLPHPAADDQVLGQLFPNAHQRQAFCNCVRQGAIAAGMTNPTVRCTSGTTVGEVIGDLAC